MDFSSNANVLLRIHICVGLILPWGVIKIYYHWSLGKLVKYVYLQVCLSNVGSKCVIRNFSL